MDDVAIRELGPGDEPILEALALASEEFEDGDVERPARPLGADDAAAFLEDPSVHLWMALADDLPVGFVLTYDIRRRHGDPVRSFVYEIGVRSGWRRRGIGTALVRHVLAHLRRAGIDGGFLLVEEGNASAIAFYESLGWRAEGGRDLAYSFRVTDRTDAGR